MAGRVSDVETTAQSAVFVALQTMKERCLKLQQTLSCVQQENLALRQARHEHSDGAQYHQQQVHDGLLAQVIELTHTKEQLRDRISMVSSENRQLWSRLSQITKETQPSKNEAPAQQNNQNLIRSKTFTQNAPNPALRSKMHPEVVSGLRAANDDLSLEEISLKVLNEMLDSKAELEKLCHDLSTTTGSDGGVVNAFGFGYLNDEEEPLGSETGDTEHMQSELKRCTDGMVDIRKEVLRQQSDIKVALSNLRKKRFLEVCPSCKHNLRHQHEHIETVPIESEPNAAGGVPAVVDASHTPAIAAQKIVDFFEQKRLADTIDKMCPMCAKIYTDVESFDEFQEHVESHFIDDSELLDNSLEKNFELVSHTVGDLAFNTRDGGC